MRKLLVIDNYDSFTYNLVQMFMQYDICLEIRRNDAINLYQVETMRPDFIVISPGPKDPANAGISTPVVKTFYKKVPLLGVCLGMQCIIEKRKIYQEDILKADGVILTNSLMVAVPAASLDGRNIADSSEFCAMINGELF